MGRRRELRAAGLPRVPLLDPWGLTATVTDVAGRPVRALSAGRLSAGTPAPRVVLVPGLGAPGYLAPWTHALATWTRATVLDLPGWRAGRPRASGPTVAGVAAAVHGWLAACGTGPVVLVGHSTGAQAALQVAVDDPTRVALLVLAAPTFDPEARSVRGLLGRIASTIPRESPAEAVAVAPSYLRSGGWGLVRMTRDAQHDRPEDGARRVRVPTLVLAGRHDGLAPPAWSAELAAAARGPAVVLAGAHNAPFPHPVVASELVRAAVTRLAGWPGAPHG